MANLVAGSLVLACARFSCTIERVIPVRVVSAISFDLALALVVLGGCGSPAPTDFQTPDRGAEPGGGTSSQTGGSGGIPLGSGGVAQPGGSGAGAQTGGDGAVPSAGSAGVQQGGAGGTSGSGGAAGSGSGIAGSGSGVAGSSTAPIPCGGLECVAGQQYCRHDPPADRGSDHYMCSPFADSCFALDCSCFCNPPQRSPCASGDTCTCSGDKGRVTVVCTKS